MLKRKGGAASGGLKISAVQVKEAKKRAEEAQSSKDAAQRALDASPYSALRALEFSEVSAEAAQLEASARELREAYDRQLEAERAAADRGALEKAATAEIAAAGKGIEGARAGMVARAEAAQAAVYALIDAAMAYNQQVRSHAGTLAAAGLGLKGSTGATGGDETVQGALVRINGREHPEVDAGGVAIWVTHRAGEARLPSTVPIAGALKYFAGVYAIELMAGELMAGLSSPKKVEWSAKSGRTASSSGSSRGAA